MSPCSWPFLSAPTSCTGSLPSLVPGREPSSLTSTGKETAKSSNARLCGHPQVQGMQDLSQDEGAQESLQHQDGKARPPQMQAQLPFERFEGQLDIPAASIQAGGITHAQQRRVSHIGHVAIADPSMLKLDQAHQMPGFIRVVGSQPDKRIQDI